MGVSWTAAARRWLHARRSEGISCSAPDATEARLAMRELAARFLDSWGDALDSDPDLRATVKDLRSTRVGRGSARSMTRDELLSRISPASGFSACTCAANSRQKPWVSAVSCCPAPGPVSTR
jgi:hypothetical protein